MKVYLVQHGPSMPKELDPQKSLSLEGEAKTRKIAEFLRKINLEVDTLWHSSKLRAVQTAQIIDKAINFGHIEEKNNLNPLDPVSGMPEKILAFGRDLMIVGHLPFLEKLASLLLTGSEENQPIQFKNSGVVCLVYEERWQITWLVIPDLV